MTPPRKFSHTTSARDDELLDDRHGLGLAKIEGDAALVAVHREKGRRHLPLRPRTVGELIARVVAFVRLDLHDVGAQQRQLVGAVRPREVAGEVEDADAGERLAHDASRFARAIDFTSSNSCFRSAIFSGESLVRSR